MRKIIFLVTIIFFLQPISVFAIDSTVMQKESIRDRAQAKISVSQDQRVSDLKARGEKEIDRRVAVLSVLINRMGEIKRLTDSQKRELTAKVQAEIDSLNALKAKIDADTDLDTLKADIKSIVDSYRIFLVFIPQIRLLGAADKLTTLSADLSVLSEKLKSRIEAARSLGKDVTQLDAWLSDLNSKKDDMSSLANAINDEVLELTPEGYPDNKSTILDAKSKMKQGMSDMQAAREDAINIIKQLKAWSGASRSAVTPTP